MVFVRQWQDFAQGVQYMARAESSKLRLCSRWNHQAGLLLLRATDGVWCLQFRTRSALFLNRFQLLAKEVTNTMQARQVTLVASLADESPAIGNAEPGASKMEHRTQDDAHGKASAKKRKSKKRK